jgi:uncharacterized repeat protein (TIGR01451 family)
MKQYLLPLTLILFFATQTNAQTVIADAGPNVTICQGAPASLGGSPTAVGGTMPYTYSWSPSIGLNSGTIPNPTVSGLTSSVIYTLLVIDALGDTASAQVTVTVTNPIQVAVIPTNITCAGGNDGSLQAVATGGTPPYTYLWSTGSIGQNMTNLPAGSYTLTGVDANGCSASAIGSVTQPSPLVVSAIVANESVTGACDGAIDLTVNGGTPPYSYNWSTGSTTEDVSGLCSGTYTATVTDANGCTAIENRVVTGSCTNNTLVVSITSQDLSCTHPTDTLTAIVSGGNQPYSFAWNNGQNDSQIIVSQAGIYTVYVTDDSGCVKIAVDTLLNTGLVVSLQNNTPVSCNGSPDGSLGISVTGGTAPYTYAWNNGATTSNITGLVQGTYTLTVTDAASCTTTASYFINQTSTNWSYYAYVSNTSANCGNNGTATVQVYGGTGPFSFLWSNSATTQTITGLTPGSYSVTVIGADGCSRIGYTTVQSSCFNFINGYVFNDANGNCLLDSGEAPIPYINVRASGNGNVYYGYTSANGAYSIRIPASGSFTLSLSNNWGGCADAILCNPGPVTFAGLGDTVNANIGVDLGVSGFDIVLHPGWTSANPGFTKQYWALIYHESSPRYNGPATIVFKYDSILQYQSSNNSGVHNATNRTITWQVADASITIAWNVRPQAFLTVPANTPIGYQLKQEFWLYPYSGDCDTLDNYQVYIQPVTGSLDPNEKEVSPAGDIVEEDSMLTYTIHFQNTGNDTTAFVILKDTLSPHLDPGTVENLASSHEYSSFDISESGILTWIFNPIFLVDSATNEEASKGFVIFRIQKKSGLPLSTEINNTAAIYFDYNEPIITNTVTNKLTAPTAVHNTINSADIQVAVAPNPFTQQTQITVQGIEGSFSFELFDVSGKLLQKRNVVNDNRFTLHRDGISAGVYFYSITTTEKQKAFGRLVVE